MDRDCSNGIWCDGVERCLPGAVGQDCRGCLSSDATACGVTSTCDEATMRCTLIGCTMPDVDGDGHRMLACSGDDCDDADRNRFPGMPESCGDPTWPLPLDHDEDCDPTTRARAA